MPWFLLCISRTFWTISFCTRRLRCFLALASIIRPSLTSCCWNDHCPFFSDLLRLVSVSCLCCYYPTETLRSLHPHPTLILLPGQDQSNNPPLHPQYHLRCHHYLSLYQKFYSNNQLTTTIILSWNRRLIWLPTATGASGTLLLYTCNSQASCREWILMPTSMTRTDFMVREVSACSITFWAPGDWLWKLDSSKSLDRSIMPPILWRLMIIIEEKVMHRTKVLVR